MFRMWDAQDVRYSRCRMLRCLRCGCSGFEMLGMFDVGNIGCWRCGMFGMQNVGDVTCYGWDMFKMWNMECLGCRMYGMWDTRNVECLGCGMFGMCHVGCGMFVGIWDVDLQNTFLQNINTLSQYSGVATGNFVSFCKSAFTLVYWKVFVSSNMLFHSYILGIIFSNYL